MYLGRIVEAGPVEDVLGHPGHPYTQALLASILEPDPAKRLPKISLDATFPNPLDRPAGARFILDARAQQTFAPPTSQRHAGCPVVSSPATTRIPGRILPQR
jgi:oligopeptide/dipeptide ABC transporter ATP-binding protein